MTGFDYEKSGFKCGLEIHQRLATRTKLFCGCIAEPAPLGIEPSGVTKRRLRAVVGELGKVDPAAAFEQARGREFAYQSFADRSCDVDRDEEPPHLVNTEALETALLVAKMLDSTILDEVHVMRKTVVDGSAVSGFQRTMLLAVDGGIQTTRGRVGIQSVCLEEESSGIVEGKGSEVVYRLDRLGIPLIEIATDASVKDGEHAREVAEKIGLMLRNTGRVQRGIGTIRQDLNISINGGTRIEVKGAQELDSLAGLVESEAKRQAALLEIKRELEKRKAKPGKLEVVDISQLFSHTQCSLLKRAIEKKLSILALKLSGFAGLVGLEIMPGHRLGTEFSHYAKQKTGILGIIHSDEDLAKYGISDGEKKSVERELKCAAEDAWIMVSEEEEKAGKALEVVFERANACFEGVPKETRKAEGVKTVFMRPLPGSARMYPETDVPPIDVDKNFVDSLKIPQGLEEKKAKLVSMGLNEVLADKLLASPEMGLFDRLNGLAEPSFVAVTLLETLKSLKRDGIPVEKVGERQLGEALSAFSKGIVSRNAVPELVKEFAAGAANADNIIKARKLERFGAKKLKELVDAAGKKGLKDKKLVFEEVMKTHRLNVEAKELLAAIG